MNHFRNSFQNVPNGQSGIGILFSLSASVLAACTGPTKTFSGQDSQEAAISAVSKNLFGTNVRGYMWALTTSTPEEVDKLNKAIAPAQSVFTRRNQFPWQTKTTPEVDKSSGTKASDVVKHFYQCWYYAESPFYIKLDPGELKTLFLDKVSTKNVNLKFVDVEYLYGEQQKSASLRKVLSFGISVGSAGLCGLSGLLFKEKSKNFRAMTALVPTMCGMAIAAFNSSKDEFSGGDQTWGSEKAKEQIEKQIRAKIDQLDEINWDALNAIKTSAKSFNADDRQSERTQYVCPPNDPWVAALMTDDKATATPTPTPTPTPTQKP